MPTFVQVSGGRTSGYMAYLLKDQPDTFFMFQNTGRENPATYDFLNEMDKRWGLNLICLEYHCPDPTKKAGFKVVSYETANRNGVPFAQLIQKRKAIPNRFKRFCTAELKVKTARRYIRGQGYKKWNYAIGYRADEAKRQVRSDMMQTAVTPLRDVGITATDVANFWNGNDFDLNLPLLPNGKTFGGNCEGCFWHSEYQNATLCKQRPESAQWLIEQEEKMGHTFNTGYSYKDLLANVQSLPDTKFDNSEYFCLTTNGSCGL